MQTISCLLIHPNPDSALNSSAGALLQEDYEAFAHQARLMTSIHAPIPPEFKDAVTEAKLRGEDEGAVIEERDEIRLARPRKEHRVHNVTMKEAAHRVEAAGQQSQPPSDVADVRTTSEDGMSEDENEDQENDPSRSPIPVKLAPPSPRRNALGKRPLSVLTAPFPEDPDTDIMLVDEDDDMDSPSMTSSERNICANNVPARTTTSPQRKSPKLSLLDKSSGSGRIRNDLQIYEDGSEMAIQDVSRRSRDTGKENQTFGLLKETRQFQVVGVVNGSEPLPAEQAQALLAPTIPLSTSGESSKVSKKAAAGVRKVSSSATKARPRIGVRRL